MKQSVAIIGGGVAGLTAAYLLHEQYDITLYEKDNRLGGNAFTYTSPDGDDIDISVFAFSSKSYPNFFKLLGELGVATGRFSLRGISATSYDLDTREGYAFQPMTLRGFLPAHFRRTKAMGLGMMRGIDMLDAGELEGLSMREALPRIPELTGHTYLHFCFMLCLMSSMLFDEVMAAPAPFFFGKVKRHMTSGPTAWRLVKRRTKTYVNAMADRFRDHVRLDTEIRTVVRDDNGVTITTDAGDTAQFNKVIFACPADQALGMLDESSEDERRLLGAWRYRDGLVVVHRDDTHFPPEADRNLYCYMYSDRDGKIETSINACYNMQKGVSKTSTYLGTQHPNFPIREDLIAMQRVFRTPIFDPASVATRAELRSLNGRRHTYYCGSHFGHGLHEDAVRSAVKVANALGVQWS